MKEGREVKSLLWLFLSLSYFSYAQKPQISAGDMNKSSAVEQNEIAQLKQRVKALEKELAEYKTVKPLAGKPILPKIKVPKSASVKKVARGVGFSLHTTSPKTLSVYYEADLQTVEEMRYALLSHGFIVLATDEILKGKTVISFTSEALKSTNSFMSVLHLLVNEGKEIRVQNPSYFAAAYLQEKYHYGDFNSTLQALDAALGGMYEVKENLKLNDLAEYHFMFGMPNVEDTILVAKGDDLKTKAKDNNHSETISYTLDLPSGALLVGHRLSAQIYEELSIIKAENNAQIFPYQVMIENERAYILAPKYYLALSLPLLSMTDFLKIASAPEKIVTEISQSYK